VLKQAAGLPILDPQREEWMLQYLQRVNRGPLSQEGLADFFAHVLDLTKREVSD
jgi:chorismate mutase